MVIEINDETAGRVAELVKATGRTASEVVQGAIEREYEENKPRHAETKMSPEKKAVAMRMLEKAEKMPRDPVPPQFDNLDDDAAIYGV